MLNSPVLQQMLKMMPSCPNTVGIQAGHVIYSGVFARKMLNSHGGHRFLVLPECDDLFYTLYLLNFPTNKSNKMLSQGNVGAKDRA